MKNAVAPIRTQVHDAQRQIFGRRGFLGPVVAAALLAALCVSPGLIAADPQTQKDASAGPPPVVSVQAQAATPAEPPKSGKQLYGVVTGSAGKPLAGARVWARPTPYDRKADQAEVELPANYGSRSYVYETTTDEKGQFALLVGVETDFDRNRWDLVARASGHASEFVGALAPGAHEVELEPSRPVSLSLSSREEGVALTGAAVYACDREAARFGLEVCRAYRTDEKGRVAGIEVGAEQARLFAHAPRHAVGWIDLPDLGDSPEAARDLPPQQLSLRAGFDVSGRCTLSSGEPAVDASISIGSGPKSGRGRQIAENSYPSAWRTYCDEEGDYRVVGLNFVANHALFFRKAGYLLVRADALDVEPGTFEVERNVTLVRGAKAKIALIGPDEEPFQGKVIFRYVDLKGETQYRRLTQVSPLRVAVDDAYVTTIDELPVSALEWVVSPEGFKDFEIEKVQMVAGETVDLGTFTVEEGREVAGWVLDQEEQPVEAATVSAVYGDAESGFLSREVESTPSGEFRIGGLPEAGLRLTAKKEGYVSSPSKRLDKPEQDVELKLEQTFGIKGSVLGIDGEPVSSFTLIAAQEDDPNPLRSRPARANISQGEGSFVHEGMVPGKYTLRFVADAARPHRLEGVEVSPEGLRDLGEIQLEAGEVLTGRVIRAKDESPATGAIVTAVSVAEGGGARASMLRRFGAMEPLHEARADEEGRFEINNLGGGRHTVSASFESYPAAREQVEIQRGVETDVELVLKEGGSLTGIVRKNGEPVPNATVMLYSGTAWSAADGRDAKTDSDGSYRLEGMEPGMWSGMYVAQGQGRGFNLQPKPVQIRAGQESVLDFGDESEILIRGIVRLGGDPLPDARIILVKGTGVAAGRGGGGTSSAECDEAGRFEIAVSAPGAYTAMVMDGVSLIGSKAIEVPDQPEVDQDLVFEGTTLSGRVTDAEGQAVAGASVVARSSQASLEDFASLRMARSSADGSYVIEGVPQGSYTVAAEHPDFRSASQEGIQVTALAPVDSIDFMLEKGRRVRGRVVDRVGAPIVDASVFMVASGKSLMAMQNSMGMTNSAGQFDIQLPSDDPVDMGVWAAGWAPSFVRGYQAGPEDREPLQVVLTAGGSAAIRLVSSENTPVPNTPLRIAPAFSAPMAEILVRPIITDQNGYALAENLAPGAYTVSVDGQATPQRIEVVEGQRTEVQLVVAGTVTGPN